MADRLHPGDPAPDFTLADDTGATVSLSDFRGRNLIVYFYPAAMTPGCTTQACDFSDSLEALTAHGYAVIGISPDARGKLAADEFLGEQRGSGLGLVCRLASVARTGPSGYLGQPTPSGG